MGLRSKKLHRPKWAMRTQFWTRFERKERVLGPQKVVLTILGLALFSPICINFWMVNKLGKKVAMALCFNAVVDQNVTKN